MDALEMLLGPGVKVVIIMNVTKAIVSGSIDLKISNIFCSSKIIYDITTSISIVYENPKGFRTIELSSPCATIKSIITNITAGVVGHPPASRDHPVKARPALRSAPRLNSPRPSPTPGTDGIGQTH